AKLDLGSGEQILHSDKGNPLNDLAWHTVDLSHDRFNVTLTVDKHFQTSQRLSGSQQQLDISDGLYIGGTGGLDKVYLPNDLTGFRGCLDEVLFNQNNLLSSLRPYSGLKNVYEVSLGCSPQFLANEEDAISFFSSRAYISLPLWSAQKEWTLECSVHTSAQEGIIMYNSAREGGFVAMEIHDGLLVAVVGRDGMRTELRSLTFINNKKWHYVKLYFTSKSLQLTIDRETVKTSIKSRSKTFHLKGFLFLGGVDDGTRSEVRKVGLSSVAGKRIKGGSFKGCFRDIKVNGILTGLPNALVTKDVSVGCEPEKEPQVTTTARSPIFESVTHLPSIDMSTLAKGLVAGHGQNFLQLRNLVVPEGGRASLESKHIKVNLDFKKLGIRQSQIMFRIEEQPVHGQLRFDVDQEQEDNTFSMLDLWHGRVMYIHGGSEDPHDYFMFSIYSSSRKVTPSYLKGEKLYRFNVTVTPTNDAPELSLPEGNLFVLLENSKRRLTTDVLKATDVDSNSTDLVYSVLGNLNADAGFLETEDNPGQAATSFPHSALEAGKINYAHTGVKNSRIVLRVSDGEKISNTVVLRIMAVKLEYSIANNTGVEVTQGETALINNTQLAIQTNAVRQAVDIRYDVVEPPRYLSTFKDIQTANKGLILLNNKKLSAYSTFNQMNITNMEVEYQLIDRPINIRADINGVYIKNNGLKVFEGESKLITNNELFAETLSTKEIYYTVTEMPKHGKLVRINLSNSTKHYDNLVSFTNQDIIEERLMYVHDDSETTHDQFRFTALTSPLAKSLANEDNSDSKDGVFNITIQLVNDEKPVRIVDKVFHVVKNGQRLLTLDDLCYHDADSDFSDGQLVYTRRGIPIGDLVLVNDTSHKLYQFHQEDLEQKRVLFLHRGLLVQKGQTGTFSSANFNERVDSFTQYELKNALLSINVKVYLESHQKPPVLLNNKILVVDEGKPVKIERGKLEVTHEANLPKEIIFTVKVAPAYGYLRQFHNSKEQFQGIEQDPLMTFTQQDINTGNIQYVQITPEQVNDSFVLEASNGVAELSGIVMSIDIIPQYIPIEVSNITLKEGASKALTENIIRVISPHFSGLHFVYYVSEGPMHGHIENSRFPGTPTTYFTRKQVEQEFIYYVHDNSETFQDYFTVIANATDLRKHSTPRTVHVQVTPVNDKPPVITANRVLRVWVSSITEITPEDLYVEDDDTAPEQLHYLTTQPSNGHLALKSAPTRPVMNFTQAHIDQGQLLFVHSGATAGGFNFQVNDGVSFAPRQIFSVTARTLVLHTERSGPLKVFPGASSSISKEVLSVATNDNEGNSNRTIVFTIVNPPKFGKLVTVQADMSSIEISSFTQKMVDEGKVAYEQTVDSVGWAALDKFTFTVSSPPASLEAQTFDIDISYENTGPERNSLLLKNTGAVVIEGDKVIIDKTMLDASNLLTKQPESRRNSYDVWYQVKSLPQHGVIVVGERNLTKEKPYFSQFILNKYGITYQHDNSETMQDRFVFDAFLNLKSKPAQRPEDDREVLEEMFNITVTPVNDQPPVLKTKAPSLKVVQGDTVALGPSNLNVEDLDNFPDDIQYSVISRPSNGFLSLAGSLNVSVDTFSQAQINNGEVFFVQDGSPASGVFYFSVTDGHHRPVYKLFNLEVLKIAISIVNQTDLILEQGQTAAVLNQSHLAAVTNGKNTTVQYKISASPNYGKLLLDNEEVTVFNQDDLRAHRISYHMVNLSSSHDNFEFTAFTSEANLTDQMVNITVKPLIRYVEGVRFSNGIRVKLKADFLNVSELALISGSDPLFEILSPPLCGKILKTGKEKKSEPTKTFLFSELQQEKLAIELKANLTEVQELNDSLRFVLKAGNLQPAHGEFIFSIVPYDPALITMTTAISLYTSSTASPSQTTVMSPHLISKSPSIQPSALVTKAVPKFKGRNRWANSNRSESHATTRLKPTYSQEIVPVRNQPVRVESVSESSSSSNPMLIILPLLALLLVVIVIILVLLLRRKQQKKKKQLNGSSARKSCPDSRHFQGHPERTATVPLVTVTPLTPSNPGSPALMRLQTGNPAYGQSVTLCSFGNMDLEATQFCRTTNPTLQHNQYWV
ncbi:hypothetical protein QTP70_033777, partial [Hemibagrus guttatus]